MITRLSTGQTRASIARLGIERPLLSAFALADGARHVRYAMHAHSRHQLLLAGAGSFWVETRERLHMCDASVGLWVPAGCRHATTMSAHGSMSVFFSPSRYRSPAPHATAIAVTPLIRQMATAALDDASRLPRAVTRKFFDVLFALTTAQARPDAAPLLTSPRDPALASAVEYLLAHLETVSVRDLARAAVMGERTLRRRFVAELRLTPEQYVRRARLLRGAQLLVSEPGARVIDVAARVGYSNQSAFTAAFREMFGVSPRETRSSGGRKG